MITLRIKRICTENIVEDVIVVDFEREGPTLQMTEDVEDLQTQHKDTLSLEKSILASQIETKIHQYQMLENRTDPTKKKPKNSKYNPMAFEAIYRDRKKFKYFTGLYPEQFTILFNFLGPTKESLHYWGTKSYQSKIRKYSLKEQFFITLLRLRRGFNVYTLTFL